ncbi:free fatty acid receptor 2-like [Tiliqua scincoides]|uniref:free fatty acid receptor 2-like n=1 Tax=Tiliqua scincoides TaxID=71010 RepID=UPI0034631A91
MAKTLALTAYILTFLTGLPSNLLVFYAFLLKVLRNPAPIDIFLLNLTVSDIILLVFLPFKIVEADANMTWPLPSFLCPLTNFCFYSSIYTSTLFLMGVSVERYLCVAYPVAYKLNRKVSYATAVSVFFWLLAYSHCSVIYIVENHNVSLSKSYNDTTCFMVFSESQLRILLPVRLELCVVLFFLPFLITIFCYVNVIRILASLPNVPPHKKQRAMGLAVVTLLNFTICFGLFNISHIVGFIQNRSPNWRVEGFLLSTFNTTLDPAVFFYSSATIRRTFAHCWFGLCRKLQAVASLCRLTCWKGPRNSSQGLGTERGSVSRLQGVFTVDGRLTDVSAEHAEKITGDSSHPAMCKQAHHTKHQQH